MAKMLKPCPFCSDPMEDRGYGAVHMNGKGCPIGDLAIDVKKWNRRAIVGTRLPPLPEALYEHYPAMSAQSHEEHVKEYVRAAIAFMKD